MNIVSASIAVWTLASALAPEGYENPRIAFVPQEWIGELRYANASGDAAQNVVAVYADEINTIYLRDDWNAASPADLSVLVHEFVHHVQNQTDAHFACPAEREAAAYALQEQFLGLFGRSLESEYGIDDFTLMMRTTCLPM